MNLEDTFRYMVGAYYGISEMDEYDLKTYVLKDIEEYITQFIKENPIKDFDYVSEAREVESNRELKTKLQDSLVVLPKVNASTELILLVKARLKRITLEEIYALAADVSDNGEIDGNWIHEELLFEENGGHGMIFEDFSGSKYLILHSPNENPYERPIFFEIKEENGNLKIVGKD